MSRLKVGFVMFVNMGGGWAMAALLWLSLFWWAGFRTTVFALVFWWFGRRVASWVAMLESWADRQMESPGEDE